MKLRPHILLVPFCAQVLLSSTAFAQQEIGPLTREEWQAQVERSRQKVEQIRREGKFVNDDPSSEAVAKELDREMARRAVDDEDLRPGDLVSTEKGLLRFEGVSPDNKRVFTAVPKWP